MKALALILLCSSSMAFATGTTTKLRAPANTEAQTTAGSMQAFVPAATSTHAQALLGVDFIDLSKGTTNAQIELLTSKNIAPAFSFSSASAEENRKKLNDQKVAVNRTRMGVGATYYVFGTQAAKNILISPSLIFGQEQDPINVENQSGLGIRIGGQVRPTSLLSLDGGINANNLSGDMRGDIYVRIGVLL